MARIGIYPGTFDPVHAGHIAFATAALLECQLDEVVFLPEKSPRGKQNVTAISHRVALLSSAITGIPALGVAQLSQPTFTVRGSLPELRSLFEGAELTLLVGSDVARGLMSWPDAGLLLATVRIAVGMRSEDTKKPVEIPDATFIRTRFAGLTSSQIRSGRASHVTATAAKYAQKHALYRRAERSYAS